MRCASDKLNILKSYPDLGNLCKCKLFVFPTVLKKLKILVVDGSDQWGGWNSVVLLF